MADGKVVIDVILDDGDVAKGVADVDRSLGGLQGSAEKASVSIGKIASALGLVYAAKKGIDLLRDAVQGAFERIDTMEQFERVMSTMIDDTDAVSRSMERMESIVEGTSVRLDVMADGVQNFVTRGLDVDQATDTMEAWGNAVAYYGDGSNEQLQNVTDALQNMVAKGTVGMDQLNRLYQAGIPAVEIYADSTGKSVEDVQNALSDGEISAEEFVTTVSDAMMEGTEKFPEISSAMEDMGMSWGSVMENVTAYTEIGMTDIVQAIDDMLENNGLPDMRTMIDNFGRSFGETLSNIAEKIPAFAEKIKEVKQALDPWLPLIKNVAMAMGILATAIISANTAIKIVTTSMQILNAIFTTTPIGMVVSAVFLLAGAFVYLGQTGDDFGEIFSEVFNKIGEYIEEIIEALPGIVESFTEMLPEFIESGKKIITNIIEGITEMLPELIESFLMIFEMLLESSAEILPLIYEIGFDILTSLIEGIVEAIPFLIEMFAELIETIIEIFMEWLPRIIELGSEILLSLIEGIVDILPELIDTATTLIDTIITTIVEMLPELIESGIDILNAIIDGILNMLPELVQTAITLIIKVAEALIDNLPEIVSAGVDLLLALVDGIISMLPELVTTAIDLILKIAQALIENLPEIIDAGIEIILALVNGLIRAIPDIVGAIPEIVGAISDAFLDVDWADVGKRIISSIAGGISGATGSIKNAISDVAGKVRNFLPFSPAKEGPLKDLDKLDFGGPIENSLKKAIPNVQAELQALLNIGGPETVLSTPEPSYVDVGGTYEITIVSEIDGKTLAKETVLYTAEELESLKKRDRRR